jgi:DNA-binding response OmpR family regulator
MLVEYLRARGFAVEARHDLASGRAALRQGSFDALVLDLMLPDGDGLELCRSLRTESDLPVLMLTARGDPTDRVVGLELGADDYLPKPFDPRELLARLRAILRRRQPQPGGRDLLRFGRLEIDAGARQVRLDGQPRVLTAHQFNILHLLASSAGRVPSRDAIMDRLRASCSRRATVRSMSTCRASAPPSRTILSTSPAPHRSRLPRPQAGRREAG